MLLSDVCSRDSSSETAERLGNFHSCKRHSVLPQHLSDLIFVRDAYFMCCFLSNPKQLHCVSVCVVGGGIQGFSTGGGS